MEKVKVKSRKKRESFITIDMAIKGGIISFILLSLVFFKFIEPNISKRKGKGGGGAESAVGEVWPR